MENDVKAKRGGKRTRMIVLLIVAAVILIAVIFALKFWNDINNPADLFESTPAPVIATETDATPDAGSVEATPTPTPDPEAVLLAESDLEFMKNRVNIMLLGIDESTERENWGSFRTDTMILVSIDFTDNSVDMISIPRDSYVKIYRSSGELCNADNPYEKINSAFSKGGGAQKNGYAYTMTTVSKLLGGVPIDYYVCVNMNAVKEVVDAMGGVDYTVDVEIDMNGRHLDTGFQHLTGQQVLDYCRMRHADSDLHRIDRQQRMLMSILSQLKSSGQIANIPQIYKALEANIATNLSFSQISSLALIATRMNMADLARYTVEASGVTVGKSSCLAVRTGKLKQLVKDVFGIDVTIDPDIDYSNIVLIAQQQAVSDYGYYDEDGNFVSYGYAPDDTGNASDTGDGELVYTP